MTSQTLLNTINRIMRNDAITKELLGVSSGQLDKAEIKIMETGEQKFVDTATWGLDLMERELDITSVRSKPLGERRSAIMAKWRGVGTLTLELIQSVVEAYTGCQSTVKFTGIIKIIVDADFGKRFNVFDLYNTLYEVRPAHLAFEVVYHYTQPVFLRLGSYTRMASRIKVYPHMVHDYKAETTLQTAVFMKYAGRITVGE